VARQRQQQQQKETHLGVSALDSNLPLDVVINLIPQTILVAGCTGRGVVQRGAGLFCAITLAAQNAGGCLARVTDVALVLDLIDALVAVAGAWKGGGWSPTAWQGCGSQEVLLVFVFLSAAS
jgi:hypothetical protein